MYLHFMKSKLHKAIITEANLNYVGSITIDENLMKAVGIHEGEKVQITNNNNGERLETYVIKGEPGSGVICLNGAAARKVQVGDEVIIIAYCMIEEKEVPNLEPKVAIMNKNNEIIELIASEKHGDIK